MARSLTLKTTSELGEELKPASLVWYSGGAADEYRVTVSAPTATGHESSRVVQSQMRKKGVLAPSTPP